MQEQIVPDSEARGLVARLPAALRGYALLARFDRPIGWWLLFWPCACGAALGGLQSERWTLYLWLLAGSIAMRGAGCVFNDIVDRDLDARVARTRNRPVASGAISVKAAWVWLLMLVAIGFATWWHINLYAKLFALAMAPLVALYPFMKRITWWPQFWLGLVFGSGALVGFAAGNGVMFSDMARMANLHWAMYLLYGGAILWVIGYDTIYALQDKEDDALVGIKSSARRMGRHVKPGVGLLYAAALMLWAAAMWQIRPDPLALLALTPMAAHLAWQVATLKEDGVDPLVKFRANRFAGLLMFLACIVVGAA